MVRPKSPYPADAQDAHNFAELFYRYSLTWSAPFVDGEREWGYPDDFGNYLMARAEVVATEFPDTDLWSCLEQVLRHTMKSYKVSKGSFAWLFERNLRERFRRNRVRAIQQAGRRREAAIAKALNDAARDTSKSDFRRWSEVMLRQAGHHLHLHARTYLEMRWANEPVAVIAEVLGTTEDKLNNQFGGGKLTRVVRKAIRQAVLALPVGHRRLLVRHLRDTGLSAVRIVELLNVDVPIDDSVPFLDEEPLLRLLGWQGAGK